MDDGMKRLMSFHSSLLFIACAGLFGVAPTLGAAPAHNQASEYADARTSPQTRRPLGSARRVREGTAQLPQPVSFRMDRNEGLIVDAWLNGAGPYRFAIDTGAGTSIITQRVASGGSVALSRGRQTSIAGITGATPITGQDGSVRQLALGDPENLVSSHHKVLVTSSLPQGIDGILDPTEAYWPLGYSVDLPGHRIEAFDPVREPLSLRAAPPGGTVVRWITDGMSRRPFVKLDDGRLVLLDTGSSFGLALNGNGKAEESHPRSGSRDIGGGSLMSKRVQPSTVNIGSLTLRGVPTDLLFGVEANSPILLGRGALYPFKLVLDPVHRLVAIMPAAE